MEREHGRRRTVRPRWPAVTRTSRTADRTSDLVPTLLPSPQGTRARVRSQRHLDLLTELDTRQAWSDRALHACLRRLLTSTVTDAARVWVVDAWTEPADDPLDEAVCVVYRPPHDEGRVVALRRRRRSALTPSEWRIGDLTTWGWDVGVDDVDGQAVGAERFGWNMADFDIGEPLGYVTTVLRHDATDIGWWGDLEEALPVRPG